ncbi:GAF domain-containing SpoIIE family protein phosphatase [Microbacterium sp. NPDC089180]|uniref:GAF domain-containing SpoIIE family protein phosphatase n=1 Tax=Microbacterium galbum TaxID=3075994 RepID=A0ABU3T864_9MICO|nr:GAF domain-containing SpoIIE family protein phosphatase [Microbacterium sp. KSW4-17]MDU0367556.1 GAF domain-containing SpoIIE family protein phosphatase [Microbacterium sp. KSW4-17]
MTFDTPTPESPVERTGLMDSPPEERFDRITRLARELFDVDYALVNIVDTDEVYTKSQPEGPRFGRSPREAVFCGETVKQDGLLEVDDATADERFRDIASVTEFGMRFYAGFPLRTDDGDAVGTLCLLDSDARSLSDAQRRSLEQFGRWAQAEVRQSEADASAPAAPADPAAAAGPATGREKRGSADGVGLASLAIPHGVVSGDSSGWQQVGGRVVVTLADVMGKGEAAGAVADALLGALQARRDMDPVQAMLSVEDEARADGRYRDVFATVFHAVVDAASGTVDFVDAGHGLTLVLHADGTSERLDSRNLPLGLRPADVTWEPGRVRVGRGDLLVSVSDGALDAYDSTLESLRMIGDDLRAAADTGGFFDELALKVSTHEVDDDVTAVVLSVH